MERKLAYLAIVLVFIFGWLVGRRTGKVDTRRALGTPTAKPDTVYLHDTVRLSAPPPKTVRIRDTILMAVHDTTVIHRRDSVIIPLPLTQSVYSGDGYSAWITGYHATLDSLHLVKTTGIVTPPTQTKYKPPTRWGIGLQAGATYLPETGIIPYVGVGISYNFIRF